MITVLQKLDQVTDDQRWYPELGRPLEQEADAWVGAVSEAGTRSDLDPRDIALVEALLRRGAQRAEERYLDAVAAGCARAGALGPAALVALEHASAETPATHSEDGRGPSFTFRRRRSDFDVEAMMRWLNQDQ